MILVPIPRQTLSYTVESLEDASGRPRPRPPEVLRGDPLLAKRIIEASPHKEKSTCLVLMEDLSWEKFGGRAAVEKLMDRMEEALFPGLEKDEYHSLFVRHHREDGKVEINVFIPALHLPTGKHLKVYYYKADKTRLHDFAELYSLERGLPSARDPERRRTMTFPKWIPKHKESAMKLIDDVVSKKVADGEIFDRSTLIESLRKGGYKINRVKRFVSVEDENGTKVRLNGPFYVPGFDFANYAHTLVAAIAQGRPDPKREDQVRANYNRRLSRAS